MAENITNELYKETAEDRMKRIRKYKHKIRMKVSNLVTRKHIDKSCCFCGEPGTIIHNIENPYFITFACQNCRKDKSLMETAYKYRFDIREGFDKRRLNLSLFTDKFILETVEAYLNEFESIGTFCDKRGISRHQFNLMIEKYQEISPNKAKRKSILKDVTLHSHKVQQQNCVEVYYTKVKGKKDNNTSNI